MKVYELKEILNNAPDQYLVKVKGFIDYDIDTEIIPNTSSIDYQHGLLILEEE